MAAFVSGGQKERGGRGRENGAPVVLDTNRQPAASEWWSAFLTTPGQTP